MAASFSLKSGEPLSTGMKRVLRERIEAAMAGLSTDGRSTATTVHEVRKRLKELRAGLRLVRSAMKPDAFATENAGLRGIARPLSDARDAEVMVESLAALKKHFRDELKADAFASVGQRLQQRRKQIVTTELDSAIAFEAAAEHLRAMAGRLEQWGLSDLRWAGVGQGVRQSYRRGRRAMRVALDTRADDALHEWRKRVKDLRYQLTILRPLWPELLEPLAEQTHALGTELGDDHDLAVLSDLLGDELRRSTPKSDRQALQALIDRRRKTLQHHAKSLGRRLYAEKPRRLLQRIDAYWRSSD